MKSSIMFNSLFFGFVLILIKVGTANASLNAYYPTNDAVIDPSSVGVTLFGQKSPSAYDLGYVNATIKGKNTDITLYDNYEFADSVTYPDDTNPEFYKIPAKSYSLSDGKYTIAMTFAQVYTTAGSSTTYTSTDVTVTMTNRVNGASTISGVDCTTHNVGADSVTTTSWASDSTYTSTVTQYATSVSTAVTVSTASGINPIVTAGANYQGLNPVVYAGSPVTTNTKSTYTSTVYGTSTSTSTSTTCASTSKTYYNSDGVATATVAPCASTSSSYTTSGARGLGPVGSTFAVIATALAFTASVGTTFFM